jgi:hypothetical protein
MDPGPWTLDNKYNLPMRPSALWKDLPAEKRLIAATAFWNDEHGVEQQVEVIVTIARKLNFRPKSVPSLPIARRAKLLAGMDDVSDVVASRALIAYHLEAERPMMGAFLDALGITHDNGLITAEDVAAPDKARLTEAVRTLKTTFPADAVQLYLHTLVLLDGDTWANLDGLINPAA